MYGESCLNVPELYIGIVYNVFLLLGEVYNSGNTNTTTHNFLYTSQCCDNFPTLRMHKTTTNKLI